MNAAPCKLKPFFKKQDNSVNSGKKIEAGDVLKMFLNFQQFEPQRSYKHGSYKT